MKAIYDSGLHHPLAAYVVGFFLMLTVVRRARSLGPLLHGQPFLLAFVASFGVEILLDATITGAWSPIATSSPLYQPLSIVFVILGDLRYFLLAERYTRPRASTASIATRSLLLSLAVPVSSGIASKVVAAMADPRVLFLVYELMLLALAAALQTFVYGRRSDVAPDHARFVRRVSVFVMVQYAGWASADVLILSGNEFGHLWRIVPNVLYYAAFLPFVFSVAPTRELSPVPASA